MSYAIQNGCRVECGYKTIEEASKVLIEEGYEVEPNDLCIWEDPAKIMSWKNKTTDSVRKIIWIEDDE